MSGIAESRARIRGPLAARPGHRSLGVALALFLGAGAAVQGQGFVWRTKDITATVVRDPAAPLGGQFLHLEQRLRPGELGWTSSKLEMPEAWKVTSVEVGDDRIVVTLDDGSVFALTAANYPELQFAILDGGTKSERQIADLWREHALVRPSKT